MHRILPRTVALVLLCVIGASGAAEKAAPELSPSPYAIEHPDWFKVSFLDFKEDIAEAAAHGKRLIVYFGQDGCPYCEALMKVNFSQKDIVDQTRRHFDVVAINLWGDRPVTWLDGKTRTEKEFCAMLKVQFTPTLLFFDEQGNVVVRANGYYPPHKFRATLDYVSQKMESKVAFAEYLAKSGGPPASGKLHAEPFFMKPPLALQRDKAPAKKPLAVFFEQKDCAPCDELHRSVLPAPETRALIGRFDVAQIDLHGAAPVLTPDGRRTTEAEWAKALKVAYAPTVVFFDERGREVFRAEAYLKQFHVQSALDYVASRGYEKQPSFQRFVQARADKLREEGKTVDLWK
ncbi:MAG: thioredoxin family protein [Pseudomonadota bacterium]